MSARVAERPTGEQPTLREDAPPNSLVPTFTPRGGNPYPPVAFDDSMEAAGYALRAMRAKGWPSHAEPRYDSVGALMDSRAGAVPAPPMDRRVPGATLRAEAGASFAAFTPAPAPEFDPAPVPGWREGVVRGLLIAALWSTARWYGAMDGAACADCDADAGLCAWHAERQVKAVGCEKLHDCISAAPSDADAVALVTGVLRSGRLSAGDLAFSRSPLEGILLAALGTDGGAE